MAVRLTFDDINQATRFSFFDDLTDVNF